VRGTIKAVPATVNMNVSFGPSEYYPITFTWDFDEAAFGCQTENASYTGAISLLGYQGSGKMHGVIAGTVTANYGTCELGAFSMGPLPFSGVLTKYKPGGVPTGPEYRPGLPVAPFEHGARRVGLPGRAHVEQVDEEVVGQRARRLGEDAMRRIPG